MPTHPLTGARAHPRTLLLAAVLCVTGCSSPGRTASKKLMHDPIAPASDALFNAVVYTNGELVAAPRTEADWSRLDDRARALASAALPLRALAPATNNDVWMKQADLYAQAVAEARTAVARRDVDEVLAAGGKLYASCAGCHDAYVDGN